MPTRALRAPALPRLKPRKPESHKGSYGSALLVGGSRGMSGAVAMAGMAALKTGAGTVRLAVPDCCLETVASFSACMMTQPLANDAAGRIEPAAAEQLAPWLDKATCLALGPGLGQSPDLQQWLLETLPRVSCPVVIDADGLNNLASSRLGKAFAWRKELNAPLVITPHPGEWSRLSGVPAKESAAQAEAAFTLAAEHDCVIVLKGHRTLVTDGATAVENDSGTPAMAIGGSGDVLTGMITALICQGLEPRDAAHLGVYVHGLAGEIAARELATHVVLPTELIDFLPRGFAQARGD